MKMVHLGHLKATGHCAGSSLNISIADKIETMKRKLELWLFSK